MGVTYSKSQTNNNACIAVTDILDPRSPALGLKRSPFAQNRKAGRKTGRFIVRTRNNNTDLKQARVGSLNLQHKSTATATTRSLPPALLDPRSPSSRSPGLMMMLMKSSAAGAQTSMDFRSPSQQIRRTPLKGAEAEQQQRTDIAAFVDPRSPSLARTPLRDAAARREVVPLNTSSHIFCDLSEELQSSFNASLHQEGSEIVDPSNTDDLDEMLAMSEQNVSLILDDEEEVAADNNCVEVIHTTPAKAVHPNVTRLMGKGDQSPKRPSSPLRFRDALQAAAASPTSSPAVMALVRDLISGSPVSEGPVVRFHSSPSAFSSPSVRFGAAHPFSCAPANCSPIANAWNRNTFGCESPRAA
eukprot:TRINITY_DN5_c0_g2_i1.p1 TRINITY_DN5_c0_g2~~TRINITY_DN5_c0_g2_i1.p1  ORF type:complete len:358 (-),score=78.67 TRINITY_DN5_c0_g2_i1:134-1207(-)